MFDIIVLTEIGTEIYMNIQHALQNTHITIKKVKQDVEEQ